MVKITDKLISIYWNEYINKWQLYCGNECIDKTDRVNGLKTTWIGLRNNYLVCTKCDELLIENDTKSFSDATTCQKCKMRMII